MGSMGSFIQPAGLFVAATHRDKQREKEVVQAMVQHGVDGVILAPQFSPEQTAAAVLRPANGNCE